MTLQLDRFLPYQLAVLANRVSREFSAVYAEKYGITVPEWRVLVHIWSAGPVSVREVHARVDMDKSKVSRAAARLQVAGYLTKDPDARDRRLVTLALTEQGQHVMDDLIPRAAAFEEELMDRIGAPAKDFRAAINTLLKDTP
ncbi:MAG: MarR family winged helix-turn-helix transcriptional regulator [Pseudomonadota bacterium]